MRSYHKQLGADRWYVATSSKERRTLKQWGWIKVYASDLPNLLGADAARVLTHQTPEGQAHRTGTFDFNHAGYMVYVGSTVEDGQESVGRTWVTAWSVRSLMHGRAHTAFDVKDLELMFREHQRKEL